MSLLQGREATAEKPGTTFASSLSARREFRRARLLVRSAPPTRTWWHFALGRLPAYASFEMRRKTTSRLENREVQNQGMHAQIFRSTFLQLGQCRTSENESDCDFAAVLANSRKNC
jgi:hypothetical protein